MAVDIHETKKAADGVNTIAEFWMDSDEDLKDLPLLGAALPPPHGRVAATSTAWNMSNDDTYILRQTGWRKLP